MHYTFLRTYKAVIQKKIVIKSSSKLVKFRKVLNGSDNLIEVGSNCLIDDVVIRVIGSHNKIIFGNDCRISRDCSFWIEGNGSKIVIGDGTSMNSNCHFMCQEDGMSIIVGSECMFANNIIVRTSDSHPIYNESHKRINMPGSVNIGNKVWVTPRAVIMKGVSIADNSIIGLNAVVTKDVPPFSIVVGAPARVVKNNVHWEKFFI